MTRPLGVGIDFGTSNCAAGHSSGSRVELARLTADSPYLPSVLYADTMDTSSVEVTDNDPELRKRFQAAKARVTRRRKGEPDLDTTRGRRRKGRGDDFVPMHLDDAELLALERAALLRERLLEQQKRMRARTTQELLLGAAHVYVGDEAVRAHIADPTRGSYFRSPKRFLGSDLRLEVLQTFERVVAAILAHIREQLARATGSDPDQVVLGRPVTYSDVSGMDGDAQAVRIMRSAAIDAGFTEVEFLLEPVAAALEYERSLQNDVVALVIDAGGGTTDCSMMRLGPSRRSVIERDADILAFAGVKSGGVDIDQRLTWDWFTPVFGRDSMGRDGLPLPSHLFAAAVDWYNVPAQAEFYASARRIARLRERAVQPELVDRLLRLCSGRLTARLARSAELTKIALTDKTSVHVPLHYLASDLTVSVDRVKLATAAERFLDRLVSVAQETVRMSGTRPEVVYVTGGTARSPIIQDALRERLGFRCDIVIGDLFGSVASGLALHAARLFADSDPTD